MGAFGSVFPMVNDDSLMPGRRGCGLNDTRVGIEGAPLGDKAT
jgi:hypothetical protein